MRAGRLDRKIDIQRVALGYSGSGEPQETWTDLASRLPASYSSVRGEERNTSAQWVAREQVEFWIRWTASLADTNPKDRIIYPAIFDGVSPEDEITERRIYDIISVHEVGRRQDIKITAARRADA